MKMKTLLGASIIALAFHLTPALAETAEQLAVRMTQMEDQMRRLMGQVEELTHQVQQLQGSREQPQQTGNLDAVETPKPLKRKMAASASEDGIEQIEDLVPQQQFAVEGAESVELGKAPGPKMLGTLDNSASQSSDGGFQGQVLVPLGGQSENGAQAGSEDGIETVSLGGDSPESLYERSNESLLRRRFDEAESGFRSFVDKYPDHNLAGSAQYWLGETYYAQGNYRDAAQNFLQGYRQYPKGRRAPDSLLKLGISLARLGQKEQACASYGAVSAEYPKAVEAKKRAQAESKRAGC
ncbi:MAG: tol-pal system protein YbgF [Aestuariivirga sp.]